MSNTTSRLFCSLAAAVLLSTAAHAQVAPNKGQTQPVPTTPSINLSMDNRHVLKENLLKTTTVKPEAMEVDLEPGKKVPPMVKLHSFPREIARKIPQIKSHEFFISDDAIVVVQTQQRIIVEVVK